MEELFKVYDIKLELVEPNINLPTIQFNQNDLNVAKLRFHLINKGSPVDLTGTTLRLAVLKPDRKVVFQDVNISIAADGEAEVILLTESTNLPGHYEAELMVYDSQNVVSVSRKFKYSIFTGVLSNTAIESTNEFQAINRLVKDAENNVAEAQEFADKAALIDLDMLQDADTKVDSIQSQVNQLVVEGDSSVEAAQARVKADETTFPTLRGRLNDTDAQLAQKATQSDLNTTKDKVTNLELNKAEKTHVWGLDNLSTEAKAAMTGGSVAVVGTNSTGTENIKYDAVTPTRTNFIKRGKNFFDKTKALKDFTIDTAGNVSSYVGAYVSDYIDLLPSTNYILSTNRIIVFYGANKEYLSGITTSGTFVTPSNCYYVRIAVHSSFVDTFQIEQGTTITAFEAFNLKEIGIEPDVSKIKDKTLDGKTLKDKTVELGHINFDFVDKGKNLFNKTTAIKDKTFRASDFYYYDSIGTSVSDYIEILPSTEYILSLTNRPTAFFDANKVFISGLNPIDSFTSPPNAKYVRISVQTSSLNTIQLETGNTRTTYEPFSFVASTKNNWMFKKDNVYLEHRDDSIPFNSLDKSLKNKVDTFQDYAKMNIQLFGHVLCDIPTYDNDKSVGHPSVVYKSDGWNGYKYWMGFTPYPHAARENPSIVVSNDGINWEVPNGLVNPIFTQAQSAALGYGSNSDTHLIFSSDKTKLMLYFRSMNGKGEGINLATSTDGVNWTVQTELITYAPVGASIVSILSPAVLIETDGTYSMWAVNQNGTDKTQMVEKRTSTDGLAWSAPTVCYIPIMGYVEPYHLDVQLINGVYHMLLASNDALILKHLTSADGLTWAFNTKLPQFSFSGFDWDKDQHYRSCFIPKANGKFDIWVNGIRLGATNAWADDAEWRIAYYPDVDLTNGIIKTKPKTNVYYGTRANAPTTVTGYVSGDRYEYTDPVAGGFVGKIVVADVWKDFGTISQ